VDAVPDAVDVRDLVGDELQRQQDAHEDEDVGPLQRGRGVGHAGPAEQPGDQQRRVRTDPGRPAVRDGERKDVHGEENLPIAAHQEP